MAGGGSGQRVARRGGGELSGYCPELAALPVAPRLCRHRPVVGGRAGDGVHPSSAVGAVRYLYVWAVRVRRWHLPLLPPYRCAQYPLRPRRSLGAGGAGRLGLAPFVGLVGRRRGRMGRPRAGRQQDRLFGRGCRDGAGVGFGRTGGSARPGAAGPYRSSLAPWPVSN